MKRTIAMLLALMMVVALFAGCQNNAPAEDTKAPAAEDTKAPEAEVTEGEEAPAFDKLELALFRGGYGEMWDKLVALFQEYYPDVEVTVDQGDSDLYQRLKARLLTDDVPDLVIATGGSEFNVDQYIRSGIFAPINDMYENGTTYDGRPWTSVMDESALAGGLFEGNYYKIPYAVTYRCWWQNNTLFDAHGWETPDTWDEFMALAADIKEAGIYPFGYSGLHAGYLISNYLTSAVTAAGGVEAYNDCYVKLTKGAWESDAAKQAVQQLADIVAGDYMYPASIGGCHTQTQIDFLNDQFAFLPCGTWLEEEMGDAIPDGFEMQVVAVPCADEDGLHYAASSFNAFSIPAKAKNMEAVEAFLGVVFSIEGLKIVADAGLIPTATDLPEDFAQYYTEATYRVVERYTADDIRFVENCMETYYPSVSEAIYENLTNLMMGDVTVDEACANIEAAAEEYRNDPDAYFYG